MIAKRAMLHMIGAVALCWPLHGEAQSAPGLPAKGARIVLLGTAGGPPPHVDRSQPAILLDVDGKHFLVDAGENAGQQLMRAGVAPSRVDLTLLTHLHWDHTLGLDYLMATGWMMGRSMPMPIWGPPGTREMVDGVKAGVHVGEDIFRPQTPGRPPLAGLYPVREIDVTTPQVIAEEGGVKISAVANSHYAGTPMASHGYGADKSYAYRFDTPYGSVLFTGDTGPSRPLADLARGADVLVSEIVDLDSIRADLVALGTKGQTLDTLMEHMEFQHLTPGKVGRMAQEAGVKTLVLTHFVTGKDFDPQRLLEPIRRQFKGEIVLGKDLDVIPLKK